MRQSLNHVNPRMTVPSRRQAGIRAGLNRRRSTHSNKAVISRRHRKVILPGKSSAKQIPAILVARLISSNTLVLKKSIANFIRKNAKRRNNILTSPANPKLLFNIPHSVRFLISFWGDNLQYFKFCDIH